MLVGELIEWLGCWAPYLEIRQESRSSGGVGKGIAVKLIQGQGDSNHHCLHRRVSIHSNIIFIMYVSSLILADFLNTANIQMYTQHSSLATAPSKILQSFIASLF